MSISAPPHLHAGPKVATGCLRNEPVVEALFKSYLAKVNKIERGVMTRTGSSRHCSEELAQEMLLVLGDSKDTKRILQPLGTHEFDNSIASPIF